MKAIVTGGGGFLGGAIVRMLREQGHDACSFSRGDYPRLADMGVRQFRGDITDRAALLTAAQGCDIMFHVAAKAGIWGAYDDFHRANVAGTENVLAVCKELGISKLVHTSSPSVVFDGRDVEGGDESLPYPATFHAAYPETKALAERLILAANCRELATVALRPHLIWGPDDNHLTPRILAKGRAGKLRRIGLRPCLVDTVYVDNAAHAHILAAQRLSPGAPVSGKAYFISNGEPLPLWDMVNRILAADNIPPVTKTIPPIIAYAVGVCCETVWKIFNLAGEPPMTRFVARELSTAHWFDISAARRDLGYAPPVSIDEGLERLKRWLARELT